MPPIRHVFVLMLENRSFDHMLGAAGLRGIDPATGQPTEVDGLTPACSNVDPRGNVVTASTPADYTIGVDPPHDFLSVKEQLCGPGGDYPRVNNSGFVLAAQRAAPDPRIVMRCFAPEQLPVLNALAREFCVCDHWFSSMPGPTWPNRYFVHAASSAGLDDSPSLGRDLKALVEGFRFANGSIYDRLDAARIPWRIYHGDEFPQSLQIAGMPLNFLRGRFRGLDHFAADVGQEDFAPAYVFLEPNYGHILLPGGDFRCGNSQHPLDDVTRGERLLKDVYEAIRRSPHWPESLLIVTYDEHGGFYDHVPPPPTVAPGDPVVDAGNCVHGFDFRQLGARVPAVVVSPLIPPHLVDHTVYDHSSVLATVEEWFDLPPLTERDRHAATLAHLFSLDAPRDDAPTTLPNPAASGFTGCEELAALATATAWPADAAAAKPVDGTVAGILAVALLRQMQVAASEDRGRIADQFQSIQTRRDAAIFLQQTKARLKGDRSRRS